MTLGESRANLPNPVRQGFPINRELTDSWMHSCHTTRKYLVRVLDVDLGFQPDHAAAIKIDYDDGGDRTRRGVILQETLRRVNALPGIEAAGVADMLPLDRNRSWGLAAKGIVESKEKN